MSSVTWSVTFGLLRGQLMISVCDWEEPSVDTASTILVNGGGLTLSIWTPEIIANPASPGNTVTVNGCAVLGPGRVRRSPRTSAPVHEPFRFSRPLQMRRDRWQ